ncbi:hypothetical protein PC114_g3008 [Phytophthora cactorum]|uniref:Uncharacterized protein n=1 Tax=Phytophthora cactorum TaxID=29920 RepID=A0A8T1EH86_9STRA|nr:hypothetical protein PC114_g3008 [Phytophthora cactorum]KAG2950788.1 hypothetical protein PC117_g4141 [Phytophthora cactorum]
MRHGAEARNQGHRSTRRRGRRSVQLLLAHRNPDLCLQTLNQSPAFL